MLHIHQILEWLVAAAVALDKKENKYHTVEHRIGVLSLEIMLQIQLYLQSCQQTNAFLSMLDMSS